MDNQQSLLFIILALIAGVLAGGFALSLVPHGGTGLPPADVTFEMVTGEWKYESPDGKTVIETYRWDPATLVVAKGSSITLKIFGVKGSHHTIHIEGLGVHAEVTRGQTMTIEFTANKKGIFPILCLDHPDTEHQGPMVGYLVIQ
jgi:heme/copper-type cytochrome/quinol oxidase subunit 2